MAKTKILVREVLDASERYDVVFADLYDGDTVKDVQVCMPKYCQISTMLGKEVYFEVKNGTVRVSQVKRKKKTEETGANEADCSEG